MYLSKVTLFKSYIFLVHFNILLKKKKKNDNQTIMKKRL